MPTLAEIQIRDPFVVTDAKSGRYLMYGTAGFGEGKHGGFLVRESRDLEHWSEPKVALSLADGPEGASYFWAPEVHEYRGRWYLFGTFMHGSEIVKPESRYTRIYVSDTPEGPFRALSDGPITPAGWYCIDGTLHVEPDGTPWIVFVREWLQVTDGEIHAMPLTSNLRDPAGPSRLLFRASDARWSTPQTWGEFSGYRVTDGPWLQRGRGGELLMLWSTFGQGGYLSGLARSASGSVTGPWVQPAEPLPILDGGHGMFFRTLTGQLTLAFHRPNQIDAERAHFEVVQNLSAEFAE